jgi:hypothetical protein
MRNYTEEEREWLNKFNNDHKHDTCQEARFDTMTQRWEVFNYYDENKEFECFTEHMEDVVNSINRVPMDRMATRAQKPVDRVVGYRAGRYTASDYHTLPNILFSDRYENALISMIDKDLQSERNMPTYDYPMYPGIVRKGRVFRVTSFFQGNKTFIGAFLDLEDAKRALAEHNRTVTHRGYGVDYE